MLFCSAKYLYRFLQRNVMGLVLLLPFSATGYSQYQLQQKDSSLYKNFNPIFVAAIKDPYQLMIPHVGKSFKVYLRKPTRELMHWPSYPLTTGQIIARNEEWQRRNNPNIGEQIASDIIKSNVNRLIFGRKMPPANIPKF
jgi:hypothetical protein